MQTEANKTLNKPPRRRMSWSNIAIFFSVFAIIVLIVVVSLIFRLFNQIDRQFLDRTVKNQNQVQTLTSNIAGIQTQLASMPALANEVAQIKQNVAQLTQSLQSNKEDWITAHARYLIKLANDQLQYTYNVPLSLILLQTADQELRGLSGTKLIAVRQALAKDIAQLQSTPQVDVDGLYARLDALHGEIDQLPMMGPSGALNKPVSTGPIAPWWKKGLDDTWQSLKQLVVVRYNDQQKVPLLPEQKTLIKQNLHAAVGQAIWGLLHGQQEIYLSALNQIQSCIKMYFVLSDGLAKAVLTQTDQLKTLYIRPAALKITALDAFQKDGP